MLYEKFDKFWKSFIRDDPSEIYGDGEFMEELNCKFLYLVTIKYQISKFEL